MRQQQTRYACCCWAQQALARAKNKMIRLEAAWKTVARLEEDAAIKEA